MATKAGKTKTENNMEGMDVVIEDEKVQENKTGLGNSDFSILRNETVRVRFVKRQKGRVTDPKHILFGNMIEGAFKRFVPKKSDKTFKYIQILTKEEQDYLEEVLGMTKGGLNLYRLDNNYWDGVYFDVSKEGRNLHLSDPIDYIYYKILLTYTNTVAPSLADLKRSNKLTYTFVMVKEGEDEDENVVSYNVKKEAYAIASKLELNPLHMREFLYMTGLRVAADTSKKWLISKIGKMVEEDPQKVVDIYTAKDYVTRSLIARGVLSGVIKSENGNYRMEDGVSLCEDNESPSLANAIKYLANPAHADVKNRIEAKMK